MEGNSEWNFKRNFKKNFLTVKYIGLWSSVLREIMKALSLGTFKIALKKKPTIEYLGERTVFELASGSQTEWLNWSSQSLISSGQTMPYVFSTQGKNKLRHSPVRVLSFPMLVLRSRGGWAPERGPGEWNPPIHPLSPHYFSCQIPIAQ